MLSIFSIGKKVGEIECNSYILHSIFVFVCSFFSFCFVVAFFFLFHSPSGEKNRISEIVV